MDDDIVISLCKRLKCFTEDIHKLHKAKESLSLLQHKQTFLKLLGYVEYDFEIDIDSPRWTQSRCQSRQIEHDETVGGEIGEEEELGELYECEPLPDDKWHGYFEGFEVLNDPQGLNLNENKKCIQLRHQECQEDLKHYLRTGVRSFMIDLFCGTQWANQKIIVRLRESEINVSKEFGFPVVSTLFAKISPRYQYTGYLEAPDSSIDLIKGEKVFLTTDRQYSCRSNSKYIYVNARFLLVDVRKYDFILVGCDIQLLVIQNNDTNLHCCVAHAGKLKSHLPVLFPPRCHKFRMSYEELEDITFAKEAGINVIVSDIAGTEKYLKDLQHTMKLLQCENIRLFARVELNRIIGCDNEMKWVAEKYDGFIVEVVPPKEDEETPAMMRLCPDADCFMQLAFASKKPIIMDAWPVAQQLLRVEAEHYFHIFYYPDKYLVRCDRSKSFFYFSFLQSAIFETIPPISLAPLPYCDESHTGADVLARSAVTASFEMEAAAIVVCGTTARMVEKLAHYRPNVPIIFVSHMRSAEDYVSLYHNVVMLPFSASIGATAHGMEMYKKTLYGIAYLTTRNLVKNGQQMILIYSSEAGPNFPDKYIVYKYEKKDFTTHLAQSMFTTPKVNNPL